eukprot:g6440.t1
MALPAGLTLDEFHESTMEESRKRKRPPSEWHRAIPTRDSSEAEATCSALDGLGLALVAGRTLGFVDDSQGALLKQAHGVLKQSCPLPDLRAIVYRQLCEGRDYRRFRTLVHLSTPLPADDGAPAPSIVGAVALQMHALEGRGYALELAAFATARPFRGCGQARRLLEHLGAIARRARLQAFFVAVPPKRRAFWEHAGFSVEQGKCRQSLRHLRERAFISAPGCVMMRRALPPLL